MNFPKLYRTHGQWLVLVGMVLAWIVDMGPELRLQPQVPLQEDRL